MQIQPICVECQVRRQRMAVENHPDPQAARAYLMECLRILSEMPDDAAAPWLAPRFEEAWKRHISSRDRYEEEKRAANAYALQAEAGVREKIAQAEDPLRAALSYARVGNYLDFAALAGEVDFTVLDRLTEQVLSDPIDDAEYAHFCADLEQAEMLLYLTDNAGEVVYDKLLLEQIAARYPHVRRVVAVRGGNALNDATREDAKAVGLDQTAEITDTGVNIPGVQLSACSEAFRQLFAQADVILGKGQANVETLLGCGANIYYLFLCKCEVFTKKFNVPKLKGMFVNERRMG